MIAPRFLPAAVFAILLAPGAIHAASQQAVPLMDPAKPAMGWTFDNGQEFPGAKGGVSLDESVKRGGQPSLKLAGDFTGGGNYVQAATGFEPVDINVLSFWVKNLQADHLTIRVIDGAGRCHQFKLTATPNADWQQVIFPLQQFFANQGKSSAVTMVSDYQAWGGGGHRYGNDGKWNGPAKSFVVLIGKNEKNLQPTIWLNDVAIIPRLSDEEARKQMVASTIAVEDVVEDEVLWEFHPGNEFPGAKGSLTAAEGQKPGRGAVKLAGDFSGGGLYVAAIKKLDDLGVSDIEAIRLMVKSADTKSIGIRLGDSTDQTHQKKNVPIVADGEWHEVVIKPAEVAGSEHWGGANDGKWHGPAKYLSIALGKPDDAGRPTGEVFLADTRVDALTAGAVGAAAFAADFEASTALPEGWKSEGAVAVDATGGFKGKNALVLEKTPDTIRNAVTAVGPAFPIKPGPLEVSFAVRSDLESMDNSYQGSLRLEFLNGGGGTIRTAELAALFRKNNWKPTTKTVEVPEGAVSARFVAGIQKETPGKFWIDELAAAPLTAKQTDDRIKRLMFSTAQLGNLIFPEDSKEVEIEVWAAKPLPDDQRKVVCEIRDYWGAEQSAPMEAMLERAGRKDGLFVYKGKIDLAPAKLETGRYYEVHGSIARGEVEPFTNYTSLAILPEAPANSYKADEVPFTSRNWDNRIEAYVRLTRRLGIRICGVWGRMTADPAKLQAPQLDLIEQLKMGWLTGSPAHTVEQRQENWKELLANDGALMRKGVRNFIEKYGHVRPMIVNLGNEPHSKGDDVKIDIEAYRIVYTEIKKVDPTIYVVGSSMGPMEDYFRHGVGEWLDAYDFHTYESAEGVRHILEVVYPALFKKFGFPKPVWATEVGLNSQGMSRQYVAANVYKKFVNFFAGGGANVSWFGLLYPDPQGTSADSFGSAHNVFDCRYNRYAPKLDAIAYYNAVNAIAIKKYETDRVHGTDLHDFLFRDRDNKTLRVFYKDKGREDVFIPLKGVTAVESIRIDGSRSVLDASGGGLTLSVGEDPMALLYDGGEKTLPEKLGPPAIQLGDVPAALVRGATSSFDVVLNDAAADKVSLQAPPFWTVKKAEAKDAAGRAVVRFSVTVPQESDVREGDMIVSLADATGKPIGELNYRPSVTGMLDVQILPVPVAEGGSPALKLVLRNNGGTKQEVNWDVSLTGEQGLKEGVFTPIETAQAFFAETPSGVIEIEAGKVVEIVLPLSDAALDKVYRVKASVRDSSGRFTVQERPVSAFYGVPRTATPPKLDGNLDDGVWAKAPVRELKNRDEFYAFKQAEKPQADWTGPADLSGKIRYLWDDQYLYLAVEVTDDKAGKLTEDGNIWAQDGIQFLIDPMRTSAHKIGKYDYFMGVGKKGLQVWSSLSADAGAPTGEVKDFKIEVKAGQGGNKVYELAIPWSRLAPFKPAPGANLGFTLILNEDDGAGRDSFMTWFGNAHNKDVDTVGDLILLP